MYRFICSPRYVKLMFLINGKNIRQLSRESNMTTAHLSNVMDQFSKEGIVIKERKGREVDIHVTEKGQELIEVLRKFEEIAKRELKKETENSNELNKQEDKNV